MTGKKPPKILGADYAGIVRETGKNITDFKEGDEVFGFVGNFKVKEGTYAEFVKVKKANIHLKPQNCSFEEAASLPLAALTAYKALVELAALKKDDRILINGCSGGVGSAAVQMAKSLGCEVTGVCSTENVAFAKEIGTDTVIDYKKENIFEKPGNYDAVFDAAGKMNFADAKNLLKQKGVFISTEVTPAGIVFAPLRNLFSAKKFKFVMAAPNPHIFGIIKEMAEEGQIKPQVFKVFTLEQIKEAHKLSENGGFHGKLVIKIA